MSKQYLVSMKPDFIHEHIAYDQPRINLHGFPTYLQVDDEILPVRMPDGKVILPFLYKVVSFNRATNTAALQLEEVYNQAASLAKMDKLAFLREAPFQVNHAIGIARESFDLIVLSMGGKRMNEKELLDYIQRYITARGYYFDDETLYNYHICLKTRPFVILAGLSGTGKSKLTQLYAEALGHKAHYLRLPVHPNWNDDHYLLGHLNTITGEYVTEPAIEFLLEANADEDNLYFFCLDEMNLAHVEYYFSQFLSAMEEERPEDRQIMLLSKREQRLLEERDKAESIPARLHLPTNLFFTGTINVDETTQPISDKVIDRANTLEFFNVDLKKIPPPAELPPPIALSTFTWQSYQVATPDTSFREQIIEISTILNKADLGLGYRVLHEIELYLANSKNLLDDPTVAFDLQVKQRILPRVRGPQFISGAIDDLLTFMKRNKLPRSEQRLNEMKNRLKRDGYTSFWR
jgi:energy-coupling factor transporter ATP-binding protein EcfA2